jgi:predicted TIM-barrel fold metal-dependent hydrolase
MIIDGHAHVGGEYSDLPSIIKTLDDAGIDKVVLCPADKKRSSPLIIPGIAGKFAGDELNFQINKFLRTATAGRSTSNYINRGNAAMADLVKKSEGRVIQFHWTDPLREGIINELETIYESQGFKGIKLHQCIHHFKILSDEFRQVAEFASSHDMPVFIHLYSKDDIADFISVAGHYNTSFITGHLIGIDTFISEKDRVSDNVYFDFSCPPLVPPEKVMKAIDVFGPGRLVMGSDTPYGRHNPQKAVSFVRSLSVSIKEKAMILGENLRVLLHM